jgi:hypothetical protein
VIGVWFGWLFERWCGLTIQLLGMSLRPEGPFCVSFLVTFCGCSFELTNGECQCWISKAKRLSSTNEGGTRLTRARQ